MGYLATPNRTRRRTNRQIERADILVEKCKVICGCGKCKRKTRWPSYYIGNGSGGVYAAGNGRLIEGISFDCFEAGEGADPEWAETLARLRNEPPRFGAFIDRRGHG